MLAVLLVTDGRGYVGVVVEVRGPGSIQSTFEDDVSRADPPARRPDVRTSNFAERGEEVVDEREVGRVVQVGQLQAAGASVKTKLGEFFLDDVGLELKKPVQGPDGVEVAGVLGGVVVQGLKERFYSRLKKSLGLFRQRDEDVLVPVGRDDFSVSDILQRLVRLIEDFCRKKAGLARSDVADDFFQAFFEPKKWSGFKCRLMLDP